MLLDIALLYDPETGNFYTAVDSRGNPILVTGWSAVAQQIMLMILIEKGAYVIDPNLGSHTYTLLGSTGSQSVYLDYIYNDIIEIIEKLKLIQKAQMKVQTLLDEEIVKGIASLEVYEDEQDPRQSYLDLEVITQETYTKSLIIPL